MHPFMIVSNLDRATSIVKELEDRYSSGLYKIEQGSQFHKSLSLLKQQVDYLMMQLEDDAILASLEDME